MAAFTVTKAPGFCIAGDRLFIEEGRRKKEEGRRKKEEGIMPNAQCPMPNAQLPITNYQLPILIQMKLTIFTFPRRAQEAPRSGQAKNWALLAAPNTCSKRKLYPHESSASND